MATGFGQDTYCYDEILPGRLVSGPELVAQAVYRRLTTPRGTLDDGDEGAVYGLDLLGFIGTVGTRNAIDAIPEAVRSEVLKDDRVDSVEAGVDATIGTDGAVALSITVDAQLADETGSFTLTIGVSDLDVALLGVTVS